MTDFAISPLPGINLSDADEHELPIASFHLVVIVEPDPESYMPLPGDMEKLGDVIYDFYYRYEAETFPDHVEAFHQAHPNDVEETIYLWLRNFDDDANYFKSFAETAFAKASFNMFNAADTTHLEYYLTGVRLAHTDWRTAVIGAMYEDEVIRIANFLQSIGFPTTVLTRYCLSNKVFVNLDNLMEHEQWERTAGRKEGESYRSWFDDWMEEHGTDFDKEDDNEDE